MSTEARRAARPHLVRAAVAGAVFLGCLVAAGFFDDFSVKRGIAPEEYPGFALAVGALVAGVMSVRALANAAKKASAERLGVARGGTMGFAIQAAGYFIVLMTVLSTANINLGGLLLGGALTGIVLGIAAQQTLGNFIAGIVLLLVRPFTLGDNVVMKSGPLGGEYEGLVTDMTLFYVHVQTERGPVALPNAGVLASAIGPGARSPKEEEVEDEEAQPERQDPGPAHGGTPG